MKEFKQMDWEKRIKMEALLMAGHSKREVAELLQVHRSTVYREYNRGKYIHTTTDYLEEERYSCDLGQKYHDWNQQNKGRGLKIGNDRELADYLEEKIAEEKFSPQAALAEAKKETRKNFKTSISTRTLYRYIDQGIFLKLTNKALPIKGNRKNHPQKVRARKRTSAGESIEKRPKEAEDREIFGHWEMDTVKGKRGVTKSCMLVLTERKTRNEIIIKMPDQTAASVVAALDRLEKKWGSMFSKVFRSITVDNGTEFSSYDGMERSVSGKGKRTFLFYCHPYSSWERGTNENNNRLIRRHIPKGEDFDDRQDAEIAYIENWINNYPRGIFNFRTAAELFQEELEKLA